MQFGVAGGNDAIGGLDAQGLALPTGNHTAGRLNHGGWSEVIVIRQLSLDHQIDRPKSQHAVQITIAAVDRQLDAIVDPSDMLHIVVREHQRAARTAGCLGKLPAGAGLDQFSLERRRQTLAADPALSCRRDINDPQHRRAIAQQCDQGSKQGGAANEGLGAVDRVQGPDVLGIHTHAAIFLAGDPMVGIACLDQRANTGLSLAVGDRHRAFVGLVEDLEILAPMAKDDFTARIHQRFCESRKLSDCFGHDGKHSGRGSPRSRITRRTLP